MLESAVKVFSDIFSEVGEKLIIDSYIPSDGTYVIVDLDTFQILDKVEIKFDKKTKTLDKDNKYFDFICTADYLSKYICSNKAIKDKNIHSNNYLTFFAKKDRILEGKVNKEVIDDYYSILENPYLKYKKGNVKKMYKDLEEKYGQPDKEKIQNIKNWINDNLYSLIPEEDKEKNHLKIFFYTSLEEYKKESERYLIPNIFNSVDYNIEINNVTYGLPNDNIGLNSKKPYLENKTRKNKVPYLLSLDQVLMQKRFFDYLFNNVSLGKNNIYISLDEEDLDDKITALEGNKIIDENHIQEGLKDNFSGIYIRIQKGKELEIHDFDTISNYSDNICPIKLENFLNVDNKFAKIKYSSIGSLRDVEILIDKVFFEGKLHNSYFKEAKDISPKNPNLKRYILLCRDVLFTWFYKGNKSSVWQNLKESTLNIIKDSLINGHIVKASEQFNLRWSLKNYFEGDEEMAEILSNVKNTLREKINSKVTMNIDNDKEYYFAVGQLTSYFISLSKSNKKVHSLANPIINGKNDKRIKDELKKLYKKYSYSISTGNLKFKNLMAMVESYVPETNIDEDLILAGYLHSNLIYEGKKEEE